jgi:hypothetical protein
MKRTARFSITMPSEAAKKARTCVMKCRSLSAGTKQAVETSALLHLWRTVITPQYSRGSGPVRRSQSRMSWDRSTSSTVQKLATAFLYISKISLYLQGSREVRSVISTDTLL